MIKITSFALLFLMALGGVASAKDCGYDHLRLIRGVTVTDRMFLKPGESCHYVLGGSPGPMTGVFITQRPVHGTITQPAPQQFIYTAGRGFYGLDTFAFEQRGFDYNNQPVVTPVRVLATIEP
jgi:hypothetical protein